MSWIQTLNGRAFDLLDPKPHQFNIEEIAYSLSMLNRFNGHTRRPYSVAEHSLVVVQILRHSGHPRPAQLAGLMHDATEAYVGDIVRPLKVLLPRLSEIEDRIGAAAARRFGYQWPLPESVHAADRTALNLEKAYLLAPSERAWQVDAPPTAVVIGRDGCPREYLRGRFLELFDELGGER